MAKPACAAAIIFLVAIVSGVGSLAADKTYTNPVIDEIGPADPTVIFYEGKYHLYCTGDNRSYRVYYPS